MSAGLFRWLPGGGLTGPAQPLVTLSLPLPWLAPCLLALVDRQVFGLFAEKVSDPQWKTWLVGFLSPFYSEEGNFSNKDS